MMTIRSEMPRSFFSLFLYTRYGLKSSLFLVNVCLLFQFLCALLYIC